MQLNVLKKAYSSKIPKLDYRNIESLEVISMYILMKVL